MMTSPTMRKGKLILSNGCRFDGYLIGSGCESVHGEVVFNTSMTGYQEIITDPSYAGQLIVMTYPQIGNYGVSPEDSERATCAARALIVRELSPCYSPGSNRSSLREFIEENGLMCLSGIDTRGVVLQIRSQGALLGIIADANYSDTALLDRIRGLEYSIGEDLVGSVTRIRSDVRPNGSGRTEKKCPIRSTTLSIGPGSIRHVSKRGRAAIIDLGVKKSIIAHVEALGVTTHVFDMHFTVEEIISHNFDFLVLSNGPGDPEDIPKVIRKVEKLLGKIPILGICLGHQVTALAMGGKTYKMKFGHRGANQPVICQRTGRIAITSQNHGYAVSADLAKTEGIAITYINASDGTIEGFADPGRHIECLQFHPEASPGPHDMVHYFEEFFQKLKGRQNATVA